MPEALHTKQFAGGMNSDAEQTQNKLQQKSQVETPRYAAIPMAAQHEHD